MSPNSADADGGSRGDAASLEAASPAAMNRRGGEGSQSAKEEEPRSDGKEIFSKAQYNRWLVRQQNAKMAEATKRRADTSGGEHSR